MARLFDGTDDYLTKASAIFSGVSPTDYNITLAAWVRPEDKHDGIIMGADDGSTNDERFCIWSRSVGRFALRSKSSYFQTPDKDYDNSNIEWFHVAGVLEYDSRALYVNGVSEATNSATHSIDMSGADNFYIGRDRTGRYWDGAIAEAAAYNAALSAGQISSLAAGVSPLLVRPDALIGYWPLGGAYSANDADTDIVGGHALTDSGSPTGEDHPPIFYPASPPLYITTVAAPVVPGQGHDWKVPDNTPDWKVPDNDADFRTANNKTDYKVLKDA
jgi:hypothetical protein